MIETLRSDKELLIPAKRIYVLFLLSFVFLFGLMAFLFGEGSVWSWVLLSLCLVCFSVFFLVLLNPSWYSIHLSLQGITVRVLFRKHFYAWEEIHSFSTTWIHSKRFIAFNKVGKHEQKSRMERMNRQMTGFEYVVDPVGNNAEQVAQVLNEWLLEFKKNQHSSKEKLDL